MGFSIEEVKMEGVKLKVMDMSGATKYHELWEHYYADSKVRAHLYIHRVCSRTAPCACMG